MSRIKDVFDRAAVTGHKLFLPYMCAGDPDLETSQKLALEMDEAGADILEIGIPFSDPLADGPTIQKAIKRSLNEGTRIRDVFKLVRGIRDSSEIPLVLMTYYNPIFRFGEEKFLDRASNAGADAVLVVDLPPEEGDDFFQRTRDHGLDTVLLATPTTDSNRVSELSTRSSGFLYYVSVTGVTGVRSDYDEKLANQIRNVAEHSTSPTVMGFGVSEIEPIRQYLEPLQGVVAGSVLIDIIEQNLSDHDRMFKMIRKKVASLAEPLHGMKV